MNITCEFYYPTDLHVDPNITWFKNGTMLKNSSSMNIMMHFDVLKVWSILEFYSVNTSDNGIYQCQMENGEYGTVDTLEITQYVRHIENIPMIVTTDYSRNISFNCSAYGDVGHIQWTNTNGSHISSEEYNYDVQTQYSNYTTTSELTISNLSNSDTGNYTCIMSYNNGTSLKSTGELYVIGEFVMYVNCHLIHEKIH